MFSILASIQHTECVIVWDTFDDMQHHLSWWRTTDTTVDAVHAFFKFPSNIRIVKRTEQIAGAHAAIELPLFFFGFQTPPTKFLTRFPTIDPAMYNEIVDSTKAEFQLHVPDYIPLKPYIVLHIRRTDKIVSDAKNDGFGVGASEIELLESETILAIEKAFALGHQYIYIAADDLYKKQEYECIVKSMGFTVIQPESPHNLLPSYYDLWMMKSASLIIQSTRFSTFSLFPALVWGVPLWTVVEDSPLFEHGFHNDCSIEYYKNVQLSR